jgi:hypothetical protein
MCCVGVMQVATSRGDVPLIQLLVSYGADVNALTHPRSGALGALHIAARNNNVECVSELIRAGADVNLRSASASTPLIECAKYNCVRIAALLLSLPGVDATAVDSHGFAAHHYAAKAHFTQLAKMLPPVHFDCWSQLQREPQYGANLNAIREAVAKKQRLIEKKAEALAKKKAKKKY